MYEKETRTPLQFCQLCESFYESSTLLLLDENEELELSPTDNDASIEPFAKVGIISKGRIAAIKTIVQNE